MGRGERRKEFEAKQWSTGYLEITFKDGKVLTYKDMRKWALDPTQRTLVIIVDDLPLSTVITYPLENILKFEITKSLD